MKHALMLLVTTALIAGSVPAQALEVVRNDKTKLVYRPW